MKKDVLETKHYNRMSSSFEFVRHEKKLIFITDGVTLDCKGKAQLKDHTFARIVSGLNHFLYFWWMKDRAVYNRITSMIIQRLYSIHNALVRFNETTEKTLANRVELIKEFSTVEEEMASYIVQYTICICDDTIVENESTTDVALTNSDARVLAAISLMIKFNFIYSSLLRGNSPFEKSLEFCVDKLISTLIQQYNKYIHDNNMSNDMDYHASIDMFIYSLIKKIFDKEAKSAFKNKFLQIGKDYSKLAISRRVTIMSSLKAYVPQLRNEDVASKYKLVDEDNVRSIIKEIYFTYTTSDYEDFVFNAKNIAAYFQHTLRSILTKQDLTDDLPDINIPEYLIDESDDKSNKRDVAYFEDKAAHLYELRKKTIVDLFKSFIDELRMMNNVNFIDELKLFKINKKHQLSMFIIYKIFLCLTGECKIYTRVLGVYSRVLLLVFYYKVKTNPNLSMFCDIVECLKLQSTDINTMSDEQIDDLLRRHNMTDPKYRYIKNLLVLYNSPNGTQIQINPEILATFIKMIEDPYAMKRILFTSPKTPPKGYIEFENVFDEPLESVAPEVITYMHKYIKGEI
ncbi:MAG: hypothetical protein ACRC92_20495 [Peptostreptococcaceae bacterium]